MRKEWEMPVSENISHSLFQSISTHWLIIMRIWEIKMKNSSSRGRSVGAITYKEIINSLYNANIIIINKDKTITLSPEIATLVL